MKVKVGGKKKGTDYANVTVVLSLSVFPYNPCL